MISVTMLWFMTVKCQDPFDKAKEIVNQSPALMHHDVNKHIKLHCNACPHGVGVCLMHIVKFNSICVMYAISS